MTAMTFVIYSVFDDKVAILKDRSATWLGLLFLYSCDAVDE